MAFLKTDRERFIEKVDTNEHSGCWEWTAAKFQGTGYGAFRMRGKQMRAHRAAWELFNGEIPEGMFVCHHCDNRVCVNPSHLFLGTHSDNMLDCTSKKRSIHYLHPERLSRGESHSAIMREKAARGMKKPNAKLTPEQISEIRRLHATGIAGTSIAKLYKTAKSTIYHIIKGDRRANG